MPFKPFAAKTKEESTDPRYPRAPRFYFSMGKRLHDRISSVLRRQGIQLSNGNWIRMVLKERLAIEEKGLGNYDASKEADAREPAF